MKTFFISIAVVVLSLLQSCKESKGPAKELINEINLKRGDVISCGPEDQQLGNVAFEFSGSEKVNENFNLGIKLLHSFEYDEAEKVFAKVIDEDPACAMAYWGVAMSNFHPLWTPPSEAELTKGSKAIKIAQSISEKSERENSYINALSVFYTDWNKLDHRTRCLQFEKAMENIHTKYANDKEAAAFYALSLNAAADPADKTFQKQKKAGNILTALYPNDANHPGIVHYIIHTYDSPELAELALPAARKYASIAPSSAHALHMPSHIFTRLGLWGECINANLTSQSSAQCYAKASGIKGHWDEELHAMDYLMYAYLQRGENNLAKKQWDYLKTIKEINPANFKVAYAFAAIPSRYLMENNLWKEASELELLQANFSWEKFPWQKAIIHFTRLMGSVNMNDITKAQTELNELNKLHADLVKLKDDYKANQVLIQIKSGEAWIELTKNNHQKALALMNEAVIMEDKTEKHPVTAGEVVPAKQLLGDMFLKLKNYDKALAAYEADLIKHPNRFNTINGAAIASEKMNNGEKTKSYYKQLVTISVANSPRPEIAKANQFLKQPTL